MKEDADYLHTEYYIQIYTCAHAHVFVWSGVCVCVFFPSILDIKLSGVPLINVHRFRILLELTCFCSLFCFRNAENVGTFSFVSRRPDDQLSLGFRALFFVVLLRRMFGCTLRSVLLKCKWYYVQIFIISRSLACAYVRHTKCTATAVLASKSQTTTTTVLEKTLKKQ